MAHHTEINEAADDNDDDDDDDNLHIVSHVAAPSRIKYLSTLPDNDFEVLERN